MYLDLCDAGRFETKTAFGGSRQNIFQLDDGTGSVTSDFGSIRTPKCDGYLE